MDFIEGLPRSGGYDTMLVVVDKFSRYTHFMPLTHPFKALQVAKYIHEGNLQIARASSCDHL